jgi:hypothetical protein
MFWKNMLSPSSTKLLIPRGIYLLKTSVTTTRLYGVVPAETISLNK